MRYFIDQSGKAVVLSATHEDHAKNVKKSTLVEVLKTHARVHVHKGHFVLETNQVRLTVDQKRLAGKLYREHGCHGWTFQMNSRFSTSNIQECCHRIDWRKVKTIQLKGKLSWVL